MITATGLGLIGDMIGQHVIEGKPWEKHDWIRTLRFSAFGPLIWVSFVYMVTLSGYMKICFSDPDQADQATDRSGQGPNDLHLTGADARLNTNIQVPLSSRWILFAEKRFPIPPTRNLFLKVGIDQFGLGTFLTLVAFHYNECKFLY